jgi:hypothetical protein
MTRAPRRLSDDPAEPELARALREAQGDVLSPEAVARVQTSLAAAGIGAPKPPGPQPVAKLLTSAMGLRVGLGIVGLGLAGAVGVASMRQAPIPATLRPPDQATALVTASAEVSAAPTLDLLPPRQPVASTPAYPTAEASAARAKARSGAPVPPMPSPREGMLLLEARRALDTDPTRALALVRAHELEFPASQLGPERARIAAEARQRLEK